MQIKLFRKINNKISDDFEDYRQKKLSFYDKDDELKEIEKYYQHRLSFNKEKLDRELEKWQDDFFNLAIAINEKKDNINNFFNQKIVDENNKLKILHQNFLNLEINALEYENQKTNLTKEITKNIKKFESTKKEKLVVVDAWFSKKESQAKNYVKKIEKRFDEFKLAVSENSRKRFQQIKDKYNQIDSKNNHFFKAKKLFLEKELDNLNKKTENDILQILNNFQNHLIGLQDYKNQKIQIINSYTSEFKKLQKQANQTYPEIKKQRLINKILKIKEEDRLINYGERVKTSINNSKLLIIFIFIAIITGALNPNFFDSGNWLSAIVQQNLFIAYIAIGETFVILTGGIDLSVGSLAGFGGTIYLSLTVMAKINFILALIITLLALILIGFMNGVFVAKLKIPPFIITLAGLLTLSGAIKLILNGVPISNYGDPIFTLLNSGVVEGSLFTNGILLFVIIVASLLLFMKLSRFSRYIYATGDNKNAAKFSGIKINRILIAAYTLSGLFAALGAISLASKTTSVDPNSGTGFELDAITAVALGGTSLAGGRGGIAKTIIGWFAISILINSFSFLSLDSNVQLVAKGAIIVLAIVFDGKYNFYGKAQKLYYKRISKKI